MLDGKLKQATDRLEESVGTIQGQEGRKVLDRQLELLSKVNQFRLHFGVVKLKIIKQSIAEIFVIWISTEKLYFGLEAIPGFLNVYQLSHQLLRWEEILRMGD